MAIKYHKNDDGTTTITDLETGFVERAVSEPIVVANKYVEQFLNEHDFRYLGNGFGGEVSKDVWCYWAQGFDTAPSIVKSCAEHIRLRNRDRNVHFIDDSNLSYHVDIPEFIFEHRGISKAHFSDLLRLKLLNNHGGAWLDATCLPTRSISSIYKTVFTEDDPQPYQRSNFFAFTKNQFLSNWFLISGKNHVITTMLSEYLLWYWSKHEKAHHYFIFHLAFRAFYLQNSAFRRIWDRSFRMSSKNAHVIQKNLGTRFDASTYQCFLDLSPVHKLTHKSKLNEDDRKTYWGHLCNIENVK